MSAKYLPEGKGPLWAVAAATVLGLGFTPRMPGTIGAAVGVFLYVPAFFLDPAQAFFLTVAELAAVCLLAAVAVPKVLKASGLRDPSWVILDEVAGMLCALCLVPPDFVWTLLAFLFFRILDIFKPFPLEKLERLPGALGVVVDDVGAGILAGLLTLIVMRLV